MIDAELLESLGGEIGFTDNGLVGYTWPVEGLGIIRLAIYPPQNGDEFHPEFLWFDDGGDVSERSSLREIRTPADVRHLLATYAAEGEKTPAS